MYTLKRLNTVWRSAVIYLVASMLAIAVSSCSTIRNVSEGVTNPMTPDQSKSQVINAAREIATTLGLKNVSGNFKRESCNDQAVAPFRGRVVLDYAHAPTLEASQAEIQQMVTTLKQHGWQAPGDFHTHAPALSKQGTTAVFDPYSPVQNAGGSITIYGECRDMTTKENTNPEPVPADQLG
ncbi:hypothetical protein ACDT10_24490 [Mycobacterium intracellulare]|uniref:hypothetical protein n=1 Tax=Mycobacterium intracellulare TaxID=1767 RepID=UPI0035586D64